MVAKITFPKKVEAALNYNEAKVQKGVAVCLTANGYLRDAKDMNFYQKLEGFARLNVLNDRAITKTLHVSLNFSPTEKLPESKLLAIASGYMERIGFGEQPYLVYQHQDAGHPHLHIVSTAIRSDGSRINTHNIGRNQSEEARKEIESLFGLVKASSRAKAIAFSLKPVVPEQVLYGHAETKRSIANVVAVVFSQYRFCSLPEFNAALKQFNVVADRGKEEGRIFRHGGLTYRILDTNGNKVGVPIKASSLPQKPTLAALEKKFIENGEAKKLLKPIMQQKLEDAMKTSPVSIEELAKRLAAKGIQMVLRENDEGRLYGVTFVSTWHRCVFNGSDLGKEYSAAGLQSRLASGAKRRPTQLQKNSQRPPARKEDLLSLLLTGKEQWAGSPDGLLKKKRKKKRRPPNS